MKTFILLPIFFIGISLNLYSKNLKTPFNYAQNPVANAGQDQTIYLTQTSTATLDGSASSGSSYVWTEISTDYMSGATITNPTSKVTTVTGLPQGTFYFQLAVTEDGITKYDSMKLAVDYAPPPKNAVVGRIFPVLNPDFVYRVNLRDDTTHYFGYNEPYATSHTRWFLGGFSDENKRGFLERGRTNGMMVDKMRGKLYNTVEAGYPWGTNVGVTGAYCRSQVNYAEYYQPDSNKTYVIILKFYFPQSIRDNMSPTPDWGRFTMFDIHGLDDESGQFGTTIGRDSLCIHDAYIKNDGTGVRDNEFKILDSDSTYNKTNTVRITYREGLAYPGQDAFIKVEVNGQLKYFRNSGWKVGKTIGTDYLKITGLYDYRNLLVNANDTKSHKKFSIVTEDATIYELNNTPTVDAGFDQTISANSTTLSGFANDDGVSGAGTIVSYQWTKLSGGAVTISSPASAATSISGLESGTYQFQLKAVDNSGIEGFDTVQVTVLNRRSESPVANAGSDTTLTLPSNSLTLLGSGKDTDGTITSYSWSKLSGPNSFEFSNPYSPTTEINKLEEGVYEFELTVTNDDGKNGKDTVSISIVNPLPPVAYVGSDRIIDLPKNSIVLPGSGTSATGQIVSYQWEQLSGPSLGRITDADSAYAGVWDLIAGLYQFQLTVKDNEGLTGSKILNVTVNPASNIPPSATAGSPQTITLPIDSISLNGNGSDEDGTIASYLWTKVSGPDSGTIESPSSATTTVNGLLAGNYIFELTVVDDKGASASDSFFVTVDPAPNLPPIASAGSDQTITLPTDDVFLNGSGRDQDGTIASYAWTGISGPSDFFFADPSSDTTKAKHLVEGVYEFELTVSDDNGAIGKDTVQITVNPAGNNAPTADAGADQLIILPNQNSILYGNGSDMDGTITSYFWNQISGPSLSLIEEPSSSSTNISGLSEGLFQFELTVTDDQGAVGKDTINVTVASPKNMAPIADAGVDQVINLPENSTSLFGNGNDEDGTIVSYSWSKISGPSSFSIEDSLSSSTIVSDLSEGAYQFELAVTDDKGLVAKDTVTITVSVAKNIAPVADAGLNQTITLPTESTILYGNGTDEDGTIAGYLWTKISGPSTGTIEDSSSSFTNVSGLSEGVYQFELTVTDDKGLVGKDTVEIIVNPASNLTPVANAGADQAIILPVNEVTVSGNGIDEDGSISEYLWQQIAGPAGATINNAATDSADISGLLEGSYEFELTVTDDKEAVGKDTVKITVNPPVNITPVADAGANQTIILPENEVTVSGKGGDADGSISEYLWNQISGPANATIDNPESASTDISDLLQGVYQFELAVADNEGAIGIDTVVIKVNAAGNIAPVADAGENQTIGLPENNVQLTGNGTDTDGTVSGHSWKQIGGPSTASIEDSSSYSTDISELGEGIYQFELTVTDDKGDVGKDTVIVTVKPAKNVAPIADAGADQSIQLPVNTVSLSGTGADSDGTISSYSWIKISGPSQGKIENPSLANPNISGLSVGTYQFVLTVTDNKEATGKDTVEILVNPAVNKAPVADAGSDQTLTLPRNGLILFGNGKDEDGKISSYLWTEISGPEGEDIVYPNSGFTIITKLKEGEYLFELAVTDDKGAIGRDTVKVTVKPANNMAPEAEAGFDQNITLPTNTTTLFGSGRDKDGNIDSYSWLKISGPLGGLIENSSSSFTKISGLSEGIYQFELTVTDNRGAVGKDTVEIRVNPAKNIDPDANAGSDQTITLPRDGVVLIGTGNDPDGTISAYQWTKISGPANATINNADSALTLVSNLSEGTYQFELSVKDNKGAIAKDTVQIKVNEAPNIPPTANAGSGKTITLPTNSVTLSGSGTDDDGTMISYQWIKISGPGSGAINNADSSSATAINLSEGIYQFELSVKDNKGAIAKDTVQIKVNEAPNVPPTANAGSDKTITLPTNSVTLLGSGKDVDGTISSYQWIKISGPNSGAINNANSSSATANNLSEGTYKFELIVTDNKGAKAKDAVQVKVNPAPNVPPTANAGSDKTITLPTNSVTLSGSGKDVDGTISSYQWIKISGPNSGAINNANSSSATANNLSEGTYKFELTVTDNKGAKAKDAVQVKVNAAPNVPPTANAGSDKTITLPTNSVTLSGSGKDADGTIISYQWTKISGPNSGTINNANSSSATAINLSEGTYLFGLTVTDNKGAKAKDTVQIKVNEAPNIPPTANAGSDKTITLPTNSVTLSGSGKDADGTIISYQWTKISGPNSGAVNNANSSSATVNNLSEGTYKFELTVTDNKGAKAKDAVQVKVNAAPNVPPTANAGSGKTITLPTNSVTLSGSGTDADGTITSYQWTKISGPNSGTINNANSSSATAINLSEGTYLFGLTVTDNKGAKAKDTVQIKVNEAPNIPPTANAGSGKTITLPTNSVTLSGSGTDADGTITSYQWTKISGPNSGAINNANSSSATINDLSEGTYQFELTVKDNKAATGKDIVQVKVNAAGNISPTANAGSDKTITLPTNSVALAGSGKDADGTIVSYSWIKKSGPSDFSLNNSSSATATATGLVEGTYEFELTVTDNKAATGKDIVQVKVNAAGNISPTANAGSDKTITLPTNSVALAGSGKDEDGTITSYQWTKISGPNSGAINNANSSSATVNDLSEGTYQFELTVKDNKAATGKDIVQVKVNAAAVIPPAAFAGKDTTILYPASSVTLNGKGTKGSGEIISYTWKQISGPTESVITSRTAASTEITDLKEGTYEFEFVVTDKNGAVGKDTAKVTVALGRLAPEVNTTISVYPNPVRDITTADINTGRINTNVLITVTDISGKIIYKKQVVSATENVKEPINMSNLTSGTYVITIFFDNVLRKSIKVLKL